MQINLSEKVALITGGACEGLGRADALALGACGCKIALFDIVDGSETVQILANHKIESKFYHCDISDINLVKKQVAQVIKDFGSIDILVNNASILNTVGFFNKIPPETWNRDIQVNLIGSANVTRAVWPQLLEKKWGRVIFMSSIAGTLGGAGQTSYAASKAAVIGLAKSLALEGARFNVTVNAIAPGVIETKATKEFIREDMMERMKNRAAMRRLGKPEEIANTITFLCSDEACFITGQVISVDGGSTLFTF